MDSKRVRKEVFWEGPVRRQDAGVFVVPFFRCHRKRMKVETERDKHTLGGGAGDNGAQGPRIRLKDPISATP